MQHINKRLLSFVGLLFLLIPLSLIYVQTICDYPDSEWCQSNWSLIGTLGKVTFWPSIMFFVFTLITLTMKENVFEAWKKFAMWATPLVVILTYFIMNMESGGGGVGGPSIHLGAILLPLLYGAYFLISLGIIAVSAFRNR